jgi:hypothetical protein
VEKVSVSKRFGMRKTAFVAGLVLSLGLVVPQLAAAQKICKASRCKRNQQLVEINTKECKANRRRPAILVKRACCAKPNNKLVCRKFPKCPKKSPSSACV